MSALLDTPLLKITAPWEVPLSHLGLEVAILVAGALTFAHATGRWRSGDGSPLFMWLGAFVYGVSIEIASYIGLDNFWHGTFTVLLWFGRLPLYISFLYPVYLYVAVTTASRLGLGRVVGGLVTGLLVLAIDLPFDVLGPPLAWWVWSGDAPLFASRFLGIPVSNLYWYWAFSAGFYVVTQTLEPWTRAIGRPSEGGSPRWRRLAATLLVPTATAVVGMVPFIPYHLAVSVGQDPRWVLLGGVLLTLGLGARATLPPGRREPLLLAGACLPPLCWGVQLAGAWWAGAPLAGVLLGALGVLSLLMVGLFARLYGARPAGAP